MIILCHPEPEVLNCNVDVEMLCQGIYVLKSSYRAILFPYGYSVCNGPEPVSVVTQAAVKERKDQAYFVQSLYV